jgi:hypothetical protein
MFAIMCFEHKENFVLTGKNNIANTTCFSNRRRTMVRQQSSEHLPGRKLAVKSKFYVPIGKPEAV